MRGIRQAFRRVQKFQFNSQFATNSIVILVVNIRMLIFSHWWAIRNLSEECALASLACSDNVIPDFYTNSCLLRLTFSYLLYYYNKLYAQIYL